MKSLACDIDHTTSYEYRKKSVDSLLKFISQAIAGSVILSSSLWDV